MSLSRLCTRVVHLEGRVASSLFHKSIQQQRQRPLHWHYYSTKSKRKGDNYDRDADGRIQMVPGSQRTFEPDDKLVFDKAESAMKHIVDSFRKEVKDLEFRASGRVTPDLLSPVRVEDGSGKSVKLEEVATVGVKDGTMLIVTAFDESMTKAIEKAIYAAKLPHIIPQRPDSRTVKVPVPKHLYFSVSPDCNLMSSNRPTVEAKKDAFERASKSIESFRSRIRREHKSVSAKHKDWNKHSAEEKEYLRIEHKYIEEVEGLLKQMKKALSL